MGRMACSSCVFLFLYSLVLSRVSISECKDKGNQGEGATIGIDLGTTYSVVGVSQGSTVSIYPNAQGNRITPSCVLIKEDGSRLVGDAAKIQRMSMPTRAVYNVKRMMGRKYSDPSVQAIIKHLPYEVVNVNGVPKVQMSMSDGKKRLFSPEEISSMILVQMKEIAESALGTNVSNAVVTVPAYFSDAQRQATKDAGAIAGLNVLRIINEPTAAAIAYGLNKINSEKNILVFDLGGGTFDVSVLTVDNGVFEVLSTNGDTNLGGEDFDQRIVDYMIRDIKTQKKVDVSKNKITVEKLRRSADIAKRTLSKRQIAMIDVEMPDDDSSSHRITLTRAKFEMICVDLFERLIKPLETALVDSNLKKSEIDEVVMVGGSTRIPKVQKIVSEFFDGKALNHGINPDEAVAHGAAVQGAILSGQFETKNLLLIDVNPITLSIVVQGDQSHPIVPKNNRIPASITQTFSTTTNGQTVVEIIITEGEHLLASKNNELGKFRLTGIPPAPRGVPQIEVTFEVSHDGILNVTARDKKSGNTENLVISSDTNRLSPDEIERLASEAEKFASENKNMKEVLEVKNKIEQLAYGIQDDAKSKDKFKNSPLSDDQIQNAVSAAQKAIDFVKNNPEATKEELEAQFNQLTSETQQVAPKLAELASATFGTEDGSDSGSAYSPPVAEGSAQANDEL